MYIGIIDKYKLYISRIKENGREAIINKNEEAIMAEETENKEGLTSEQKSTNREGYSPAGQSSSYHKDARTGRPQRPRIRVPRQYNSDHASSEGGFRPEGFGAGLQKSSSEAGHERQGVYQRQGGYQSRSGYQSRGNYNSGHGYQSRGGYNSNRGGYQSRGNYNNNRGGYRPRYNSNGEFTESGYQQNYNSEKTEGGYQSRGGYQQRQGGYQSRQGGYQSRGGYQQRQGGYNRGGGYQSRGGYQQRGGYNAGGFRKRTADYDPNAKYSMKKRIEYKEDNIDPNEPIRLNKYLANAGVCSRREADEHIQNGDVKVNGEVVTELGTKVLRGDKVEFKDQPVTIEKKVYVLLNKPKDYVTTSDDPQNRKTVMDLVKGACPERIYPVGRLDRNTTGVLLLTNDGDLASKLTHPKFLKKKVYHVFLDKPVTPNDLQKISDGIELEDGEVKADAIDYPDPDDQTQVGIEIHSGKNRIVRRIFESLGYRVVKLDRVQFAGLTKKNVRRGDWRFLTEKEVEMLRMGAFE